MTRRALSALAGALFVAPAVLLAPACFKSFGEEPPTDAPLGLTGMTRFVEVPPGEECPHGGVRAETGFDRDRDGTLEDDELDGRKELVCQPADGDAAPARLTRVLEEPAGESCASGGVRVESGLDLDGDGQLSDAETERAEVLCHGAAGADAEDGLVAVSDEAPGASCAAGGFRIDVGLDLDGDGALAQEEIVSTNTLCHGEAGPDGAPGEPGLDARVVTSELPPGGACVTGGQRVDAGLDTDRDGVLDDEEVTYSATVCNGAAGGSGAGGHPPEGASEGSAEIPVALTVGTRAGPPVHAGTVSALGTSFYAFTTLADAQEAGASAGPYTIAISDFRSDVEARLFAAADFTSSEVDVSCRFADTRTKLCATAPLVEGTAYYLAVRERDNVPGAFSLTVSFSADEGSVAAPVSIVDVAAGAEGGYTLAGGVSGAGESVYAFSPAADGLWTLSLEELRGPPLGGAPALAWEIYEGTSLGEDHRLFTCAHASPLACPTPYLRAGADYLVVVREGAGEGARYTLSLLEDDLLTARLPLGEVTDLSGTQGAPPLALFVPAASGPHTLVVMGSPMGWTQYADVGAVQRGEPAFRCYYRGCATTLEAGVPVYVSLPATGVVTAHIDEGGGTEGTAEAPVPVEIGVLHPGSVGEGDDSSYYTFTPSTSGRHAIELTLPALGAPNVTCEVTEEPAGALFAGPTVLSPISPARCITEPLTAGTPYRLRIDTGTIAGRVDLTVHEGDVLTPTLAPAPPAALDVSSDPVFRIDSAPGPHIFRLLDPDGRVVRRLYDRYPWNGSLHDDVFRCETSDNGTSTSDCRRNAVLRPGLDYYLRIDNRIASSNTMSVEVEAYPIVDGALGTPVTGQARAPLEETWFRVVLPADAVLSARLDFTSEGDYRIALYDESFELFYTPSISFGAGVGGHRVHHFVDATTPVPAGTWYLRIGEGVYASETLTFDLTLTTP